MVLISRDYSLSPGEPSHLNFALSTMGELSSMSSRPRMVIRGMRSKALTYIEQQIHQNETSPFFVGWFRFYFNEISFICKIDISQ